jgi:hypothetical protein
LDSYQHHQRARWPRTSHGSVDRQPNDRLGRNRRRQLFEHRRAILRGYTNSDTHANTYSDGYSYGNSDIHADANRHGYSYSYSYGNSDIHAHANSYSYGYSYSNGYIHADPNSYGYGNSDIHSNAYTNKHTETNTDAQAAPDCRASAMTLIPE